MSCHGGSVIRWMRPFAWNALRTRWDSGGRRSLTAIRAFSLLQRILRRSSWTIRLGSAWTGAAVFLTISLSNGSGVRSNTAIFMFRSIPWWSTPSTDWGYTSILTILKGSINLWIIKHPGRFTQGWSFFPKIDNVLWFGRQDLPTSLMLGHVEIVAYKRSERPCFVESLEIHRKKTKERRGRAL